MKRKNREAVAAMTALRAHVEGGATLTLKPHSQRSVTVRMVGGRYAVSAQASGFGSAEMTMHGDFSNALADLAGRE